VQFGLSEILKKYENDLHSEWMAELATALRNDTRITESELSAQTREFLSVLRNAISHEENNDLEASNWGPVREFLNQISRSRALQGFTSEQTAVFIFSLKKPLFSQLRKEYEKNPRVLVDAVWSATELIDKLGMQTVNAFQQGREDLINRQRQELLELSTPVVKLWDGVLALPMIGALDSSRAQIMMESLLERIIETGSTIAIIDITGVPTVDTLVAQHLLKTVTAIRLMGADCIISGIRPQIAQTIVHLGVDLHGVITRSTLADALALALKRAGLTITSANKVDGGAR
jgi:rsbT co-antagonist protein RsbR